MDVVAAVADCVLRKGCSVRRKLSSFRLIPMAVVIAWLLGACTDTSAPVLPKTPVRAPSTTATAGPTETPTSRVPSGGTAGSPEPSPTASQIVAAPISSSGVAVSPDGSVIAAVNPDSNSVTLIDADTLDVLREVPVGIDPRTVAFTPDSRLMLVANLGSATISLVEIDSSGEVTHIPVGPMPYGVVVDGERAFFAEFALGHIGMIDLSKKALVRRVAVAPFPAGLALRPRVKGDNGHDGLLLVTHFFTGQVTAIDPQTMSVTTEVSTGADTNLSQFVVLAPDGAKAYVPQTRSNAANIARTFETTVFPIVNVLDLGTLTLLPRQRITIDTADQPVNFPFAAALSPDGSRLYIVNAGSDDLSVVGLDPGEWLAHIDVGANPRGIAITPDGSRLFVNNVLDGTISVIDTSTLTVTDTVPVTEIPLASNILLGKKIFNSAATPELTTGHWISCATCHFDGGMDARTWLGFPDGPRNTPALFGVGQTLPIHWSGDLDELHDVELTIRAIQFGKGLVQAEAYDSLGPPHSGRSAELDALAAYLAAIEVPASPYSAEEETIRSGESTFTELGCPVCHSPPLYTDLLLHDVGTGDPAKEKNSHGRATIFDTPSLRFTWMTAPYFHDGSAVTLEEVLRTETVHNIFDKIDADQLDALITFMRALPTNN